MLINLSELFSRDGKEKSYTCQFETAVFHAPDGDYDVVSKEPVTLCIKNLGDRKPVSYTHLDVYKRQPLTEQQRKWASTLSADIPHLFPRA